jgi:hypothetical protein
MDFTKLRDTWFNRNIAAPVISTIHFHYNAASMIIAHKITLFKILFLNSDGTIQPYAVAE